MEDGYAYVLVCDYQGEMDYRAIRGVFTDALLAEKGLVSLFSNEYLRLKDDSSYERYEYIEEYNIYRFYFDDSATLDMKIEVYPLNSIPTYH